MKNGRLIFGWCWFLLLIPFILDSQSAEIYHYSVADGLPSSECYATLQDKVGNLWIATDRGVSCYNGYEFKNYTTEDGLVDNTVFEIVQDVKGRIWFMGYSGLLCYYYQDSIYSYLHNDKIAALFPGSKIVRSIMIDSADNITMSFMHYGMFRISAAGELTNLPVPESHHTVYFGVEYNNGLFVGSMDCAANSVREKRSFYTNVGGNSQVLTFGGEPAIDNVIGLKRRKGAYVFSVLKSLIEIGPDGTTARRDNPTECISLFEDSQGVAWLGAYKGGVQRFSGRQSVFSTTAEHYLNDLSVTSTYEDREHGFWFTTLENGLYYMPCPEMRSVVLSQLNYKNVVTAIAGDREKIVYAGTSDGSIFQFNSDAVAGGKLGWKKVADVSGAIQCLYNDQNNGNLYLGTSKQLAKLGDQFKLSVMDHNQSRCVTMNQQGDVIAVISNCLLCFRASGVRDTLFSFNSIQKVDALCTDLQNNIYLATPDGLLCFGNGHLQKDSSSLLKCRVNDIQCDEDGNLVVATIGKGIIFRKGDRYVVVDESRGLASNIVNSVFISKGHVFAATNKGISQLTETVNGWKIRNFTVSNGLPTDEVKKVYFQNNYLWLGTNVGLVYFRVDELRENELPPFLEFGDILVNNHRVKSGQQEFRYDQNFVELNFTGYCFKERGKVVYRYRLIGLSDEWKQTTSRVVQYSALSPGNYRFELVAQNENGKWSSSPLSYVFSIDPPFWKEPVFLAGSFIFIALIGYFLVRNRIAQIRFKNKLVLQMNEFQRKALAAQMNPHFIFNSLNSINAFILNENREKASKYLNSFAKLMRLCLNNSEKKYVSVSLEYNLLVAYLELEELRFKKKFRFEIQIDEKLLESDLKIPSMLLQPYIENSILHGLIPKQGEEGLITVLMYWKGKELVCEITDNGIGRKQSMEGRRMVSDNYESLGTKITDERLKAYKEEGDFNPTIEIRDLYDDAGFATGTSVLFNLPYIIENDDET